MKKSIFLFFAAILCAMSVSAKVIYFKPNGNWAAANANFYAYVWGGAGATSPVKFTPVATDPDVYEAEVGTHTSIIFLRMDPSKAVNSSNMWTASNKGGPLWNRMGNLSIPTSGNNCCTIKDGEWTQEKDDASSHVTWSTYTPPTVVVIPDRYITGSLAGGWNANEVKMTYDEVTETYSHTFTAVAANAEQKIKVTDGTWSKSWGGADVSPAIDGITTDGDGNVCFTLKTAGDVTVTFKDSKIQVTTTGAFKVPVTYPYYILGTMNSWSVKEEYGLADEDADGVYTREITLAAGEHFFKINIGNWDSQWGWSNVVGVYTEAKDASDDNKIKITLASEKTFTVEFNKSKNQISFDGLTKIEDYYTVVGVAELFGTAWDRANETNKMAKQGDGSYKLVKENVTLAAIGYDWKIAKNGEWWDDAATGVNPSEGNNTLTIATAGRYNVTFTLAADLTSATVETELLEAAVVIPDCFISGNATLTGGEGWQGNEFTMVYDEETETWAYTLAGLQPEKEYELKVVCGGTWYSFANLATPVPTGITEGNDHSIAFKMAAAGDVVVTYNVEAGITLSGNFALPVTYDYYIAGTENLTGYNWSANGLGMTKDGDVYKHTFSALAAGTFEFKITDGQWNTAEDKTHEWGYSNLGAAYEEVSEGTDGEGNPNGNIKFVTGEAKNITVIFDPAAGKITFENLTEKAPVEDYYTIVGVTAITGVFWDPANEDNKMTKDGEVYTLTKTDLQLEAGDYEYKVAKNGAWGDGAYPAEGNQTVNIAENGVYTIVYTYTVSTSLTAVPEKTGEYTPDKPVYTVAGAAALCGSDWKADDTTNDMTDNGDGTFTWTKTGVKITGTVGFKVVKNHDFGKGAYPNDNWNIVPENYEGNAIYTVTITFTESSKDIAVTLTKTGDVTPPVISYVLMGVNGDWTNGIPMTVNPDNANEYVLKDQVIIKATDAIKVVTLTDGQATAWCGNVDGYSNATYTAGADGNIVLEDGIYTFYFKKNDDLIYINQTGYARNVTNKYGTICLPYAAASTTGAIFYRVAGKETGKVYLESVDALEAGVPYIFEKTASQIKVVYTGEKETTAGSANGLVGTFADNTPVPNDAYILYGGAFCTNSDPDDPNKINAYRAYLDLDEVQGGVPTQMPGRRYIGMSVQGENEATGVEDIFSTDAPVKVIENGQLIIIRDGVKYNVQGQKL